jgi:hypothetical protein
MATKRRRVWANWYPALGEALARLREAVHGLHDKEGT